MVAEARIEITKCRQLCYLAACMMDLKGAKAARKYIAMIKVAAPRMALHVIDEAIQVRVRCTLCVCCVYIVYGVRSVCSSMQCVQVSCTTQYRKYRIWGAPSYFPLPILLPSLSSTIILVVVIRLRARSTGRTACRRIHGWRGYGPGFARCE